MTYEQVKQAKKTSGLVLYEHANSDKITTKEGDKISSRTKQDLWRKTQAKQYTLRIMHDSGIPQAIEKAATKAGETQSNYIKKAIVMRLQDEGFLSDNVVVNRTQQRHKEKIERLKEYIAAEESKLNK